MHAPSISAPIAHVPTTRRHLLRALPAVAATAVIVPTMAIASTDETILTAWDTWQHHQRLMRALPLDLPVPPGDMYSPEERQLWEVIDAAEGTIQASRAQTPRGVAIQLYVALVHQMPDRVDEQAIIDGNVKAIHDRDVDHDWDIRLILAALRSLDAMEG